MNSLSTTLYQLLADNLSVRPGKLAAIDPDREATFRDLTLEAAHLAELLIQHGVSRGDRVIVHVRKGIAELVAMFASLQVGAVVVNVNVQWTLEQLMYVADDCRAALMILDARVASKLASTALPESVRCLVVAGKAPVHPSFVEWQVGRKAADIGREVVAMDSELAMILYTSGSTGKPKGVMLSHRNVLTGARAVSRYLGLSDRDRLLSVLPYSFDYGLNQLTTMMLVGGTVVHQAVPMPAEIVQAINRHGITGLAAVPPLWNQIVRMLVDRPQAMPSLRRITNSGGKIPPNILDLMPGVFPKVDIFLMYGLTEAFRSTYLPPDRFAQKRGSIGRAIPCAEIYVIKPGIGIAGPGEAGELVHRGPLVSMGYWERPEATREKIKTCPELVHLIGDEPVTYSGDIVEVDVDGDLWFVGRNDAMIKTSGFRLSPEEVEDKVSRSGMVGDAVAYGVPDDNLGEVVHLAFSAVDPFDEAELMKFCRREMPHYMIPAKFVRWMEPMPRTPSGKLARPEVVRDSKARPA